MNEQEQNSTEQTVRETATHEEHVTDQQQKEFDKLAACNNELAQLKDRYIRSLADFENYKRRIEKEKSGWLLSGQEMVLADMLTIVDNFDRAFKEQSKTGASENDAWLAGFKMIYKELQKMLAKHDVAETAYASFDPALHEALMLVESPDHKPGEIVEIFEKGYHFKDSVLRPAKVSVAK